MTIFDLPASAWLLLTSAAFLIGMAKTGVHGAGMAAVPLLALAFGGKASSGIALPMLIMADIFAVAYYHRHANWGLLLKLFPWAAGGVIIGTTMGTFIDDQQFRFLMGIIIFISLGIMLWMERGNKERVPNSLAFTASMGLLGGFTTMVGNLAGPVMALYLLSSRLPKNEYIGTAAWFFMVVNVFKVPFHIWGWHTITTESFLLNLSTLPLIAVGALCGIWIVKRIAERFYRIFVIATTAVAAVLMVL
ncbi:sulfite exporter TauE/SafE family protein [Saccharophagus degradans]|uniref:sulfite exporter TauE/SafE family protein n=1 Tax=Saccharophagus degradans TaxID=86304 RepID=UPI002477FD23|nr:sulfite exporter TauE/SafE family protein [Saccharophagus degradans]WGO99644.1 sulfite exporter TauE/SafE family protein [Saccharophagus degradans]